jgi:hypothetical protein
MTEQAFLFPFDIAKVSNTISPHGSSFLSGTMRDQVQEHITRWNGFWVPL